MSRIKRGSSCSVLNDPTIRFAVVNTIHQEILSANHRSIGEAYNSRDEDWIPVKGLVVCATMNDNILGEVSRTGFIKNNNIKLPDTIWSGPMNIHFTPTSANRK
jgi:hypothetical protein